MECQKISVIVAFYRGNHFLARLFCSINGTAKKMANKMEFEVILVNDSPEIKVVLPEKANEFVNIKLIENENNLGTQGARVNGIRHATGDWIIVLDQDDELVAEGFEAQLSLMNKADVIVGNGLYQYGNKKKIIYKNKRAMDYLIRRDNFLKIRNLIPSPGECLIRKASIPEIWLNSPLKHNGADDWFLWLLLFQKESRFCCNDKIVYIHNDANGQNLSLDINKMYISALEMQDIIKNSLNVSESNILRKAIEFKYLQDTGKLKLIDVWNYRNVIWVNICYKFNLIIRCF